ncbi:hypothetical protein BV20DRAFT_961553 [Pilatotrama ljubarskyi]|nr:hypothetical protein BV20DRAFT_961553 [Pilatotrama ljubarskyi]
MPKRERDEAVAELSSTIFSAMLEEILMDVVQQSHKEIARARAVCDVCHTRCNAVHVPGPSNAGSSRIPTPNGADARAGDGNSPSATGTNTPVSGNGKDGTVYFACVECKREIASNRYATHLSGCMGIGNRRGAARNATAKSKLGTEFGKSASPRLASEAAHLSDDGGKAPTAKGKAKGKAKKSDDVVLNSNGKRTGSPSISPVKKSKKAKTTGSAANRIKLEHDTPGSPNLLPLAQSATRVPSRLRESSIASSFHREQRSSSPDSPTRLSSPARSISTQASTVIRSPAISNATIKSKQTNGKGRGAAAPLRLPSPPRPPPPVPIIRMPDTDYLVDVEGEETGSSTDTDSD